MSETKILKILNNHKKLNKKIELFAFSAPKFNSAWLNKLDLLYTKFYGHYIFNVFLLLACEKYNLYPKYVPLSKKLRNINHYLTFENLIEKYTSNIGISKKDSCHFLINELKTEKVNIKVYPKNGLYYFNKGKLIKLNQNHSNIILQKVNPKNQLDYSDCVFGTIAQKGIVIGKAKIIHQRNDYLKINTNDIIVLTMTTPDIVPFLNRVKGIITDEGGLTCHAAIIAREMKIPCLVATNNSTKIFNNSENILLNANKGFAKKLIN